MKLLSLDIAQKTGVAFFDSELKQLIIFNVETKSREPQDNIDLWNYLFPYLQYSDLIIIENLFIWKSNNVPNLILQAGRFGYILGKITEKEFNLKLIHINSVRAFHKIKDKRKLKRTKKETSKECVNRLINEQLSAKLSNDIADAVVQGLYELMMQIEDLSEWEIEIREDVLL